MIIFEPCPGAAVPLTFCKKMSPIPKLSIDEFFDRFGAYIENTAATSESTDFEAAIESEAYERLVKDWENGWDFDSKTEYFGGRGASILIQNTQVDWAGFWEWLRDKAGSIPQGALINFEVYDNIKGKTMIGGPMLLRRVMTASGTFDEGNEVANKTSHSNPCQPPCLHDLP